VCVCVCGCVCVSFSFAYIYICIYIYIYVYIHIHIYTDYHLVTCWLASCMLESSTSWLLHLNLLYVSVCVCVRVCVCATCDRVLADALDSIAPSWYSSPQHRKTCIRKTCIYLLPDYSTLKFRMGMREKSCMDVWEYIPYTHVWMYEDTSVYWHLWMCALNDKHCQRWLWYAMALCRASRLSMPPVLILLNRNEWMYSCGQINLDLPILEAAGNNLNQFVNNRKQQIFSRNS